MGLLPLTLDHYFKLHGRPVDQLLVANARALLRKLNTVVGFAVSDGVVLGVDQVSGNHFASGYRSPGANAKTNNAGAFSRHLICRAGDVQDALNGRRPFAVWCIKNQAVLEANGLWMEDPRWTAGRTNTDPWVHLQDMPPGSGKRVYLPYRDLVANPATDPEFYTRFGLTPP